MARSRTIIIAGGGIGGLTAAIAVARKGYRVVVLEQSTRIEETGAGLQLSPNATRVLNVLGLGERIAPFAVVADAVRIRSARGREIVRLPLRAQIDAAASAAPYWTVRRSDLQNALIDEVHANPDIALKLGQRVEDYAVHANGVTVSARQGPTASDEHGLALIGADGLWSTLRVRLGDRRQPRFRRRTAWRATVASHRLPPHLSEPAISLWLGPRAHLVHYPVSGGRAVNIVAIIRDERQERGWAAPGVATELRATFARWAPEALALLAAAEQWARWSLYDRRPLARWGKGPVTLLGDAAHPMVPFLAQGAAMAIEDAQVLAECLARFADAPQAALREYEWLRSRRTARTQRAAALNGTLYHLRGPGAFARNLALRIIGGEGLIRRYEWLYGWQPSSAT